MKTKYQLEFYIDGNRINTDVIEELEEARKIECLLHSKNLVARIYIIEIKKELYSW